MMLKSTNIAPVTSAPRFAVIHAIIAEEALRVGVDVKRVIGPQRSHEVVEARHRAIFRAWQEGIATSTEIGKIFGNRDHSTILYVVGKMQKFWREASVIVIFTEVELKAINEECERRDKAVDDTGLGIDLSDGPSSRRQRQRVGVAGEAAVLKFLKRSVAECLPSHGLDGGIDILFGPERQWSLAVKSSVHPRPRVLYANDRGAIKTDAAVLVAALETPNGMRIVGWERRWWLEQASSPQWIGNTEYMGITTDGLLHPAALASVDNGENIIDMAGLS